MPQIVFTLAPTYVYRDCMKAKVSTIWVHGPLGVWKLGDRRAPQDIVGLSL